VCISQLKRYSRAACSYYLDFLDRWLLLTRKLLNQGFLVAKLKSLLRRFYGYHHDLINCYGISVTYDHGIVTRRMILLAYHISKISFVFLYLYIYMYHLVVCIIVSVINSDICSLYHVTSFLKK